MFIITSFIEFAIERRADGSPSCSAVPRGVRAGVRGRSVRTPPSTFLFRPALTKHRLSVNYLLQ
jgi:hypothetical protein